jgi:hypothetical protein
MISGQFAAARRGSIAAGLLALSLCLGACGSEEEATGQVGQGAEGTPAAARPASPATTTAVGQAADAGGAVPAAGAAAGPAVIEAIALMDWYHVVLVNPAAITDPRQLEAIARPYCEGLQTCRIGLWYSAQDFPRQSPVPNYQLNKQVFAFGRTLTGAENVHWNCDVFPELQAPGQCLPRGID